MASARILVVVQEVVIQEVKAGDRARDRGSHDRLAYDGFSGRREISRIDGSRAEISHILPQIVPQILEPPEYSVSLASGDHQAIQRIQQDPAYDVVLYEFTANAHLPEWLRRIRPETPTILLAAAPDTAAAMEAVRKGAYDCILQPFVREQVLRAVDRALEYRRLVQQNAAYRQDLEKVVAARVALLKTAIADLEHSYDITLEALGDALDLRDAETEGHSKRVTAFTIALARALGVPPEKIPVISRGAYLHDIGKIAIPDAILLKPSRLKSDEQKVMREHCARGYEILQKIPFLQEASEIVYSHQEHYDGTGYPRGLKGSEIPLGARIFAIADTLDAITSDRPYRKANSFAAARGEIARCAGAQFDPEIVSVYLSLPDQLWEDLRREIGRHSGRSSTPTLVLNRLKRSFG